MADQKNSTPHVKALQAEPQAAKTSETLAKPDPAPLKPAHPEEVGQKPVAEVIHLLKAEQEKAAEQDKKTEKTEATDTQADHTGKPHDPAHDPSKTEKGQQAEHAEKGDKQGTETADQDKPLTPEEIKMAEALAQVEPAAGEEGGAQAGGPQNSGFTFSDPEEASVGPLDAVGPIDPTALVYGVDQPTEDIRLLPQGALAPTDSFPEIDVTDLFLDETDLGPLTLSGSIPFAFGTDGPGTITANNSFSATGSLLNNVLSSGGIPVEVIANGLDGYTGFAGTVKVFELVLDQALTGEYTFTQFKALDHQDSTNPDDVISLVFGIVATDSDGDTAPSTLTIHVADDAPLLTAPDEKTLDEQALETSALVANGQLVVDFGNDGAGQVSPDGTHTVSGVALLQSGGHPVTIVATTTGYEGQLAGGEKIFTLVIDPATGAYTYTQLKGLDHEPEHNTIDLTFGVAVSDFDGDSSVTHITIHLTDSLPTFPAVPELGKGLEIVDETLLPNGSQANGVLGVQFGGDAPGSILPNGQTTTSIPLFSHGLPVVITQTAGEYIGTTGDGTVTVFTLTIDPVTGDYTFKQFLPLDHADATNPDDAITLGFGVIATDADGDMATGTIQVTVRDDGPCAVNDTATVAVDTTSVSGNVLGNDAPGADLPGLVSKVVFAGVHYPVIAGTPTIITGLHGTLTLHADGSFTYVSAGNNAAPVQERFTYTLKDFDGDTDVAVLTIHVNDLDDTPVIATTAPIVVDESDLAPTDSAHGTLGVDFGADTPGTLSVADPSTVTFSGAKNGTLTSHGVPVVVTTQGNAYIGQAGGVEIFRLTLNPATGAYDFVLKGVLDHADATNPDDAITLGFGVIATDADGDMATGTIQVTVRDDGPCAVNDTATVAVDTTSVSGNVLGNDAPGADLPGLVSKVVFAGVHYPVIAGTPTIITGLHGTLTLHADGSFTYVSAGNNAAPVQERFTYTLKDFDGDTDVAVLTVKTLPTPPALIVGDNVNDIPGQTVTWVVGGGKGAILGHAGPDILVGDTGGSTVENQKQDYNMLFIIDNSGSMGSHEVPTSRISLLVDALKNLVSDFGTYQSGDIKVHFTPFGTTAQEGATFLVTNPAQLAQAITWLENLDTGGFTNYESALQAGIGWLQSGDAISGAVTTTYFLSDGEPNRYVTNSNPATIGSVDAIMKEINGVTDGTNEIGVINALSDQVIGVGINIGAHISRIDVIDSDGHALNINDANDLTAVLAETNPLYKLTAVGGDSLNGGASSDIIFGDSLNTDSLAQAQGLDGTAIGSGWAVFTRLENGEGLDTAWNRSTTMEYIKTHVLELSVESVNAQSEGRLGGNDTIQGGEGNDLIFGQEGNDHIAGGLGNDIIDGGTGNDVILFQTMADGVDTIRDFNVAEGDVLDVSALLQGYDALQDSIDDFVFSIEIGGNTLVSVDVDGQSGPASAVQIAILESVTGLNIEDITNNGQATA